MKIGIMAASQIFATRLGEDAIIRTDCDACGMMRPHTYWPDSPHRCMFCVHQTESVTVLDCPSCGPTTHVMTDRKAVCWVCWASAARKVLYGPGARIIPIRPRITLRLSHEG